MSTNIYQLGTPSRAQDVIGDQEEIDTKPHSQDTRNIEETNDQPSVRGSTSDENYTVIANEKSCTCCTSVSFWRAVSCFDILLALVAIAISVGLYIIITQKLAENNNPIPLTQNDSNRIDEIIANRVKMGIEENLSLFLNPLREKIDLLSDRIEKIESQNNVTIPEIESLKSELSEVRMTSQEYRNETGATIVVLSEASDHLQNQIAVLHGLTNSTVTDVSELSQLYTQTQGRVDAIQNSTSLIEQQYNQTATEVSRLRDTVHRVETGLDSTLTEFRLNFIEPITNRTEILESDQESISTDVRRLSDQVRGYHSNGAASSHGNKATITCITVIIAWLLMSWF